MAANEEELRSLFRSIDRDKSGSLDRNEIAEVMTKLRGSRPSEKEIDEVFTDMDTDKNQIIDEKEFVDALKGWIDSASPSPRQKRSADGGGETETKRITVEMVGAYFMGSQKRVASPVGSAESNAQHLLQFGFPTYSTEDKANFIKEVTEFVRNAPPETVPNIQKYCCAKEKGHVLEGLDIVYKLLRMVEFLTSVEEKHENSQLLSIIFDTLTDGAPGVIGDGQTLEDYKDRMVPSAMHRLADLLLTIVDDVELFDIRDKALQCMHYFIVGPRLPSTGKGGRWDQEATTTKDFVRAKGLFTFFGAAIQRNTTVTSRNQRFLAMVINCLAAFAEGHKETLAFVVQSGLRSKIVEYLQSADDPTPEFLCSLFGGLSVLSGQGTDCDAIFTPAQVEEANNILTVCSTSMRRIIDSKLHEHENAMVHCVSCCQMILPLFPLEMLQDRQCGGALTTAIASTFFPWQRPEGALLASVRMNSCLVSIIDKHPTAAKWLFEREDVRKMASAQLDMGLQTRFASVALSTLQLIAKCAESNLTANIIESGLYGKLLMLLHIPPLRNNVVDVLSLCAQLHFIPPLVIRGLGEALFSTINKLRFRASSAEAASISFECMYSYNLDGITKALEILRRIIEFPRSHPRMLSPASGCAVADYTAALCNLFSLENVTVMRTLYETICSEVASGRLLLDDKLTRLGEMFRDLLLKIKVAHERSSVCMAINTEVNSLLEAMNTEFSVALEKAQRLLLRKPASDHATSMDDGSPHAHAANKRLPNLRYQGLEIELLVRPLWKRRSSSAGALTMGTDEDEPTRLFSIPKNVTFDALQKALGVLYSRVVVLNHEAYEDRIRGVRVQKGTISDDGTLQEYIAWAEKLPRVVSESLPPRLELDLTQGYGLGCDGTSKIQSKEEALQEFHQVALRSGVSNGISKHFVEKMYQHFARKGTREIDVEAFVGAMIGFGYKEEAARPLFRAFDTDQSGQLSLPEICVGLAKIIQGSEDDKISATFNAYDADGNGTLDFDEIVELLMVSKSVSRLAAISLTTALYEVLDGKQHDESVSVVEFTKLVKEKHVDLNFMTNEQVEKEVLSARARQAPRAGAAGGGGGYAEGPGQRKKSGQMSEDQGFSSCDHCGKMGHDESKCYIKNPSLRKPRAGSHQQQQQQQYQQQHQQKSKGKNPFGVSAPAMDQPRRQRGDQL